jgi:hypothetical protein
MIFWKSGDPDLIWERISRAELTTPSMSWMHYSRPSTLVGSSTLSLQSLSAALTSETTVSASWIRVEKFGCPDLT